MSEWSIIRPGSALIASGGLPPVSRPRPDFGRPSFPGATAFASISRAFEKSVDRTILLHDGIDFEPILFDWSFAAIFISCDAPDFISIFESSVSGIEEVELKKRNPFKTKKYFCGELLHLNVLGNSPRFSEIAFEKWDAVELEGRRRSGYSLDGADKEALSFPTFSHMVEAIIEEGGMIEFRPTLPESALPDLNALIHWYGAQFLVAPELARDLTNAADDLFELVPL